MTLSLREQVLRAFKGQLDQLAGVTVFRNRDTEISESDLPALVMRDGGMGVSYDSHDLLRVTLRVEIECFVKAQSDALLGEAISDLAAKTMQQVFADPTLGNLVVDVEATEELMSDPVIGREQGHAPTAAFILALRIIFFMKPGDPYTAV